MLGSTNGMPKYSVRASTRVRAIQLDVVDDPEGVLGVVMVGQFDEIGRSLYQAQLSQRGVCHRSDFGGIRIDDLQVFSKDLRGACSLGAGGVIVNVAPLKLSGEGGGAALEWRARWKS